MLNAKMTLADVSEDMKSRGSPMAKETISKLIRAGKLPFAEVINVGRSGRCTYLIWRKDYVAWADEVIGQAAPKT